MIKGYQTIVGIDNNLSTDIKYMIEKNLKKPFWQKVV